MTGQKPLAGVRVVEMGQLIAGPYAGHILAWYGAEVIKVETPGKGDPLRHWRVLDDDGTSFWWRSMARNKQSITINLREKEGQELVHQLLMKSDVLIENFKPGKMEEWGLGPERYRTERPELIYTRVSGYGQTGPYKSKPGYASACEAMGGFRYINGFADRAPVRPNLSLGDTLAGMHAVIGTLMALFHRQAQNGNGQVVDVSIVESVVNVLESVIPEYSGAGLVREPSGSTLTGIVPTNLYLCKDDRYIVIGGNGDSIYRRLMNAVGRSDLADDPRLQDNPGRVTHEQEIDDALTAWTRTLSADDALAVLEQADVPSAPIYSVEEIHKDPHLRERGLFETIDYQGRTLEVPAQHPRLEGTPGGTEWPGPELGAHTEHLLTTLLEKNNEEIAELRQKGIV